MEKYPVKKTDEKVTGNVKVPGSKSVTNRALLMAALSDGRTILNGVLFSDDSRHFLDSLKALGFGVKVDEQEKKVEVIGAGGSIPAKSAGINVGSAGTAARFLTAMLALSDGEYVIDASEQMKARPMEALFAALGKLGAKFEYIEEEGHLPVKVKGRYYVKADGDEADNEGVMADENGRCVTEVDISKSTQFLSALMMTGCMIKEGLDIIITSEKTTGSYVKITQAMMEQFGCQAIYDGHDYHVAAGQSYKSGEYEIEPDISAACYFWAMAAMTGGSIRVDGVRRDMMQGDMRFLEVLEKMGCTVSEEKDEDGSYGVRVTAPANGTLYAVDIDMNDFSDQSMTLAVVAAYADGMTRIRNIGHIRLQESDRIEGILTNLRAMGVDAGTMSSIEKGKMAEGIYINGGAQVKGAEIKTFDDHRMAMSFALAGLKTEGIVIENPMCCKKTFENYFEVFEKIVNA